MEISIRDGTLTLSKYYKNISSQNFNQEHLVILQCNILRKEAEYFDKEYYRRDAEIVLN